MSTEVYYFSGTGKAPLRRRQRLQGAPMVFFYLCNCTQEAFSNEG